jgi:PKD repeat protein
MKPAEFPYELDDKVILYAKTGTVIDTVRNFIKVGVLRKTASGIFATTAPGSGLGYTTGQAPGSRKADIVNPPPQWGPPPEPPYVPVVYTLTAVPTDLSVLFTVLPKGAGTLDYGDGSETVALTTTTNTSTYVYAAAGDYTATFTSANAEDAPVTVDVTVTAPA